jgi:putative flippase GtrA
MRRAAARTDMTTISGGRPAAGSPPLRPAVVEPVDFPPSTSDGRTTIHRIADRPSLGSQAGRFAAIGIASTLAWAGLYALLRGAGLGSVPANAIALVVTAVANTSANRRLTFGIEGRSGLARDHGVGLLAFVVAISLTTATAAALDRVGPDAGRPLELALLAAVNLAATIARFILLRSWLGRPSRSAHRARPRLATAQPAS